MTSQDIHTLWGYSSEMILLLLKCWLKLPTNYITSNQTLGFLINMLTYKYCRIKSHHLCYPRTATHTCRALRSCALHLSRRLVRQSQQGTDSYLDAFWSTNFCKKKKIKEAPQNSRRREVNEASSLLRTCRYLVQVVKQSNMEIKHN